VSGVRRAFTLSNLLVPFRLVMALWRSGRILRQIRPDVVVGTGGYVCGPPLAMAVRQGIPTVIQEQNSYPGVTTRLLARRVNEVHITFEITRKYLRPGARVFLSGNPARSAIGTVAREDGARTFGLDPSRQTVLVTGGSQGAATINSAVAAALEALLAGGIQVLWSTGEQEYERVKAKLGGLVAANPKLAVILPFIGEMDQAYAVADLAICRSGATTLAELTKAGVPSVLVPYPYAAADHQRLNAETLVAAGAATLVPDAELDARLLPTVQGLLGDGAALQTMATRARALGRSNAAETIARSVLDLGAHPGAGRA
jgi:UDP-N-acetylglucosamine--N-acetylmuramyl-(pentapeptide) pyrophosphoryl-undecaprenol N-acetylglucosamine transferase